jgi:hypothetical protein
MAKSGYKDVNVTSDGYIKLRYSWSAGTPNVANNFTPINWTLSLISTNSTANISSTASKNYSVTTDGTKKEGTNTVGLNGGATRTLASGSKNIYHGSDGKKTFSYSFSQTFSITYSGVSIGTITGSETGTLDDIPRSSILGNISNFTIGNAITIPITKYSTSFSDTLNIYVGDTWIKRVEGLTNNQSVSFTTAELNNIYAALSNVTSGVFRFVNSTYSGSNIIGTSTKTATGTINTNIKPSISSIALAEAVSGLATKFGAYIQNKSKITGTITAAAGTGSSIDKYSISINGSTYTSSTFTTDVLISSGTNTCSVTVTDKRGRTATSSTTFSVTAYENPKVTSLSVVRCNADGTLNDNGNYVKVNGAASITSLSNKNDKTFKLEYKLKTATSWTTNQTYTSSYTYTIANKIIANISADNEYDFRIAATDYFGTPNPKQYSLSSGFTIQDINKSGKGIAFGKVSSKNAMEINMSIYDRFDTEILNGLSKYESGGVIDVNTTIEELVLSSTNTPTTAFWYVKTMFYSKKSDTSNRTQIAYPYNKDLPIYYRYYINGTGWSSWKAGDIKEISISDGDGYVWDSSGYLVQWGRVTITPSAANTVTSVKVTFKKPFDNQPKVTADPNVAYPNLVTSSVGGGTTIDISKQSMIIYMTRTNTAATVFQWEAKGYKNPL